MKHDSMRLMRQSKWKASLTCIYFWLLSFYCRWIPSWGLAHNWPLIQSPNSLWRSISQDCLYGKFYYLLDDSCVLLDSRHQIWTPTAHYKKHTHTHLSVVDCWQCSILVVPPLAAGKLLAGPWKRREGGGSEGGGRQQISVTFGEGDQRLIDDYWWEDETKILNIHLILFEGSSLFGGKLLCDWLKLTTLLSLAISYLIVMLTVRFKHAV